MSDELRHAIAEQVVAMNPGGRKDDWGRDFLALAAEHGMPDFEDWTAARLISACGNYVNSIHAAEQRRKQAERLNELGLSTATGRPITPTLSVRTEDGGRQGVLWYEATPRQFIDAVMREQAVVDGRANSNAVRMRLALQIRQDERLMELPTLRDVCAELSVNPDTLGLEGLEVA